MFNAPEDLKDLDAGLERLEGLIPGPIKGVMGAMDAIESPGVFDRKTSCACASASLLITAVRTVWPYTFTRP